MICASAGIFLHPSAELTKGHQRDSSEIPLGLQVGQKGGNRISHFFQ